MKTYTISEQGEVREASGYVTSSIMVDADTKQEATRLLLARLYRAGEYPPSLHVKDGAYLLITSNIHNDGGVVGDSGRIKEGRLFPLCSSNHDNEKDALANSTFNYYASQLETLEK